MNISLLCYNVTAKTGNNAALLRYTFYNNFLQSGAIALLTITEYEHKELYLARISEVTAHWFELRSINIHQNIKGTLHHKVGNY
jgi:hypothetical protein